MSKDHQEQPRKAKEYISRNVIFKTPKMKTIIHENLHLRIADNRKTYQPKHDIKIQNLKDNNQKKLKAKFFIFRKQL